MYDMLGVTWYDQGEQLQFNRRTGDISEWIWYLPA